MFKTNRRLESLENRIEQLEQNALIYVLPKDSMISGRPYLGVQVKRVVEATLKSLGSELIYYHETPGEIRVEQINKKK